MSDATFLRARLATALVSLFWGLMDLETVVAVIAACSSLCTLGWMWRKAHVDYADDHWSPDVESLSELTPYPADPASTTVRQKIPSTPPRRGAA